MEALAATPRAAFLLGCTLYTPQRKLHGLRAIFFAVHTTCNAERSSGILVHISTFGAGSPSPTSRANVFAQTTSDFTANCTLFLEALPASLFVALVRRRASRTPHSKTSLSTGIARKRSRVPIHDSTANANSQLSTGRADAFVQTTSDFTAQLTGCFEALPALPCAALVGSCACRTPHGKPSRSRTHCLPLLTTALA